MRTATPNQRKVIIEQQKRFSECYLWKMQRDYFDQQGINAWVNQVPFYITSNPFIGTIYAKIIVRFIRDWIKKNPDAKKHPFYIMELGTGSGRFSYYTIKPLHELLHAFGMDDIQVVYVMSDFTKNNIQYHETHPALMPYIEKGLVDFAIFDMETERPVTLLKKNIQLNPQTLVNPLTVLANYIFDTVSHDSFSVHDGKLYELLVSLSTDEENMQDNRPVDWEKITVDHSVHEIKGPYYNDPALDGILEFYKKSFRDTSFLIPIAGIRTIKLLKKLCNDKLLLISSDKGYSDFESLENLGYPSMAFHGSFSMMVNYHAMGEFFKNSGGDALLQSSRRGIKTCVFSSGFKLGDEPETKIAVAEWVEGFSPSDYFNLHRHIADTIPNADLEVLASHLQLSEWDPHIFLRMNSRITSLINESDSDTINFLAQNMPKLAANYYYMPKSECILFEVGIFYHAIKRYKEALEYYQKAQPFVGEQFGLYYNIALCLHHVERQEEALTHFRKAETMDAESKETKEWIAYLEKTIAEKKFQPKDIKRD